jgi:hypothetical protein
MNENFNNPNKIEKVIEENPLLILLESKVIIKIKKERIGILLCQISNVRVVRNRDLTLSILTLVFMSLFYILVLSPMNLNFGLRFLCVALISILFIISFSIKKYRYKLLINQGKLGYNEITISKRNSIHAENFMAKFKNVIITKSIENEFGYQKLKNVFN